MVLLSAQDSDNNINKISHAFFDRYPTLNSIVTSNIQELSSYLSTVTNYQNKTKWIHEIALSIQNETLIPLNMKDLLNL
ncbi:hypothetical protein ACFS5J_03920 [Flavobacterium chuncheonense]|uniref:HhH-GPD domain-containing protein n=1 Tax=Flavobacterium chuncheonense TaxID=2026653 RepID=A0ABW5YL70_9FLAO